MESKPNPGDWYDAGWLLPVCANVVHYVPAPLLPMRIRLGITVRWLQVGAGKRKE